MKKEKSKLKIIFRNPVYPVIIVSKDKLLSGSGIKTLALSLLNSTPQGKRGTPFVSFYGPAI